MKKTLATLTLAIWAGFCLAAAPPAEKLLPPDTLVVAGTPDASRLRELYKNSPQSRMWQDPAMRPFKEKFWAGFSGSVLAPLEKELGATFTEYAELAQGQVTLALLQGDLLKGKDGAPVPLLILDAKDHAKDVEKKLADLKKKWTEAGKTVKSEKIRGVEFNTVSISGEDMAKLGGKLKANLGTKDDDAKSGETDKDGGKPALSAKKDILIGISDTLLIVSTSSTAIEQVLARQSGGAMPGLEDEADFQAAKGPMFRDAPIYFWLNLKPFVALALKNIPSEGTPGGPDFQKLVAALGVPGFRSAQFSVKDTGNGRLMTFGFRVDENGPQGLLKMFAASAKDSAPPTFVPAEAVKFSRYRLDLQQLWNTMEKIAREVYPPVSGALDLVFRTAGKDKDPNYDLRKELIGNLGDDIITYQKPPKSTSAGDIKSPPSITFVSSPNGEGLIQAVRTTVPLMGPIEIKEREFLGRKIYSVGGAPGQSDQGVSFASSSGYLAISTSPELVEEFVRSADHPGKSLREDSKLRDAAEKLGGMESGLFGFDNESEALRTTWEYLRKNPDEATAMFTKNAASNPAAPNIEKLKDWFDFSLLPPFDAVAKYLTVSAYAGSFKSSGVEIKVYFPDPPELRK